MPDLGARVRPEPVEAPEPRPVTGEQLVRSRALQAGWRVLTSRPCPLGYEAWVAGVEAHEAYLRDHSGFGSWRSQS